MMHILTQKIHLQCHVSQQKSLMGGSSWAVSSGRAAPENAKCGWTAWCHLHCASLSCLHWHLQQCIGHPDCKRQRQGVTDSFPRRVWALVGPCTTLLGAGSVIIGVGLASHFHIQLLLFLVQQFQTHILLVCKSYTNLSSNLFM